MTVGRGVTLSASREIGAARRWIKAELDRISAACGGCCEVVYRRDPVTSEQSPRIPQDTWVVNVLAIKRGTIDPNRYVIMSGDIDSRASNGSDGVSDAPGANDNASGMAGAIEAARVLAGYEFGNSVILAGLSGEERGLWGGRHMARVAREGGWEIIGVLNNDMIGNIEGVDFAYAARMTALNAAVLARLAWAPPAPAEVGIGGAVRPSTTLQWEAVDDSRLAGYKVYWRDTTAPRWEHSRWVGNATEFTLEGLVIDNYLFGVAAVGHDGHESVVAFPSGRMRRRR